MDGRGRNLNWSCKGGRKVRIGKTQYLKRIAENMPDFMIVTNTQIQEINTEHIKYKEIHTWINHTKTIADKRGSTYYTSEVMASLTKKYFLEYDDQSNTLLFRTNKGKPEDHGIVPLKR